MGEVTGKFTSSEEQLLREYLFTNPHGKEGFVYPQSLVAGEELSPLMAAYSRSHMPLQERVLTFLAEAKEEQTREFLQHIPDAMRIFRHPDGTLRVQAKTALFNEKWVLKYGHDSVKEETVLHGHAEDVSDRVGKVITGHPLNHPQVKSTRYIEYSDGLERALLDPDLASVSNAQEAIDHVAALNQHYAEFTDQLTEHVYRSEKTAEVRAWLAQPAQVDQAVARKVADEASKRAFFGEEYKPTTEEIEIFANEYLDTLNEGEIRSSVRRFVFDYSRIFMTAATRTSLGFVADARTVEGILTDLVSGQRIEEQELGKTLQVEARKIAPYLFGEKSHVRPSTWRQQLDTEFKGYIQDMFDDLPEVHGSSSTILGSRDVEIGTDRANAALIAYEYLNAPFMEVYARVDADKTKKILAAAHENRGRYDSLHPATGHTLPLVEIQMPYHGYRDLFRHRRGNRSWQMLSGKEGFTLPRIYKILGLDAQAGAIMEQNAGLVRKVAEENPYAAEKLAAFGLNTRALHAWSPLQMGLVEELRSKLATGNESYVLTTRELADQHAQLSPITAALIKVDREDFSADLWKRGYPMMRERNEN